jgi:hypothetical protein
VEPGSMIAMVIENGNVLVALNNALAVTTLPPDQDTR